MTNLISVPAQPVAFILLDKVQGQAQMAGKENHIDVLDWSWSKSQSVDVQKEGGRAGRATASNLTFIKPVDLATPVLARLLVKSEHVATAVLSLIKTGTGGNTDTYKLTLVNVAIAKIDHGLVDKDGRFYERVELNFEAFKSEYTQIQGGVPKGTIKSGWNFRTNAEHAG
jgi:type VI secretion system secreted protein Hcp